MEPRASSCRTAERKRLSPHARDETPDQVMVWVPVEFLQASLAPGNPLVPGKMIDLDAVTKEFFSYAKCNSGGSSKLDCQSSCPDQPRIRSSLLLGDATRGPSLPCARARRWFQAERLDLARCRRSSGLDLRIANHVRMCGRLARIRHDSPKRASATGERDGGGRTHSHLYSDGLWHRAPELSVVQKWGSYQRRHLEFLHNIGDSHERHGCDFHGGGVEFHR